MTTDELLEKIGKLLEAEREHTRKLVREEVGTAKDEVMARMEKDAESIAEMFHETWEHIEKHEKNLTQRVEQIEDHLGLPDPTKKN